MEKLLESIPNYSIGNDPQGLARITQPFRESPGVRLLSVEPDDDYGRTVMTVIGEPESLIRALAASVAAAREVIDLRRQHGEHPRMGAADVIPLVPLKDITVSEAVAYSRRCAGLISRLTGIPVYLYAKSARVPEHRSLSRIRQGGYEGLFEKMRQAPWQPDYGSAVDIRAGATAVGVRDPLAAFNIDLDTPDKHLALAIARKIRESGGGIRSVQAQAAYLTSRGIAQVTMNVCDCLNTPLYQPFEAVRDAAAGYGCRVTGSELVGMIAKRGLESTLVHYLGISKAEAAAVPIAETARLAGQYLMIRGFSAEKILDAYL